MPIYTTTLTDYTNLNGNFEERGLFGPAFFWNPRCQPLPCGMTSPGACSLTELLLTSCLTPQGGRSKPW